MFYVLFLSKNVCYVTINDHVIYGFFLEGAGLMFLESHKIYSFIMQIHKTACPKNCVPKSFKTPEITKPRNGLWTQYNGHAAVAVFFY